MRREEDSVGEKKGESNATPSIGNRLASLTVLTGLFALGVLYLFSTYQLENEGAFGPGTFPTLLGYLLVTCSILAGVEVVIRARGKHDLGQIGKVLGAVGLSIAFVILWGLYSPLFYLYGWAYLLLMMVWLDRDRRRASALALKVVVSVLFILFVYLFFDVGLGVRF
ncbi:tripartite tricarboxylate transporter TctB family protein [Nesterenkonia ebinurensis]|uniref:tripartite tricarboxylate transporter TctB family protein n=1 Tax=Nesterenkonia ebinurensis TaxID=2608252 RepID=UPI00123D6493|nr:tripartite tricarboxylate transporter TctB family protein [Nesterenkonia ebinurensis]